MSFEYDLKGTPCENVLKGKLCYYPENIQSLFPEDKDLVKLGAQSFLGIPFFDSSGKILGHLAAIDTKSRSRKLHELSTLKIFAARAGAEMERRNAEEALHKAYDELEMRVQKRTADLVKENNERKKAEEALRLS